MAKSPEDAGQALGAKMRRQMKQAAELTAPDFAARKALALLKERGSLTMAELIAACEADLASASTDGQRQMVEAMLKHLRSEAS